MSDDRNTVEGWPIEPWMGTSKALVDFPIYRTPADELTIMACSYGGGRDIANVTLADLQELAFVAVRLAARLRLAEEYWNTGSRGAANDA